MIETTEVRNRIQYLPKPALSVSLLDNHATG